MLNDYRLTQPDGVGWLEPGGQRASGRSHIEMGLIEVSEWR